MPQGRSESIRLRHLAVYEPLAPFPLPPLFARPALAFHDSHLLPIHPPPPPFLLSSYAVRAVLNERGDDPALAARTAEELRAEWSSSQEGGSSLRLKTVMQVCEGAVPFVPPPYLEAPAPPQTGRKAPPTGSPHTLPPPSHSVGSGPAHPHRARQDRRCSLGHL